MPTRETIMRKALIDIATMAPTAAARAAARRAIELADAVPLRAPCGCRLQVGGDLTVHVVKPCSREAHQVVGAIHAATKEEVVERLGPVGSRRLRYCAACRGGTGAGNHRVHRV